MKVRIAFVAPDGAENAYPVAVRLNGDARTMPSVWELEQGEDARDIVVNIPESAVRALFEPPEVDAEVEGYARVHVIWAQDEDGEWFVHYAHTDRDSFFEGRLADAEQEFYGATVAVQPLGLPASPDAAAVEDKP